MTTLPRCPEGLPALPAPATINTPRVHLRPWSLADHAPFAALNADADVMAHFPATLSRAESDTLVARITAGFAARGWGLWAAEERASGAFMGFVGLHPVGFELPGLPRADDAPPHVEIGWRMARAHWGKGYASEAATAVLEFARVALGLPRVVSFTATENTRSEAVMRRIGMTKFGTFDHPRLPNHRLSAHVLYTT